MTADPVGRRGLGLSLAAATALVSGVSVFVNGYGVRVVPDATVYTTAKNLVAAAVLMIVALAGTVGSGRRPDPAGTAGAASGLPAAVRSGSAPAVRSGPAPAVRSSAAPAVRSSSAPAAWAGVAGHTRRRQLRLAVGRLAVGRLAVGRLAIGRLAIGRLAPRRLAPGRLGGLLVIGVVGGSVPFVLFFEGLARASSTQAAFLHKTLVVWVALLAVPLLGERLRGAHVAAVGLLMAGQAMLAGGVRLTGFGVAETLILAATLLWAVEVVLARRLLQGVVRPEVLGAGRMAIGAVLLTGWVAVSGRWSVLIGLSAEGWTWALITGVLLAGYVALWFGALALAPAVDVTAVLVPAALVTALLNAVVAGGLPGVPALVGGLLLLVGAAVVSAVRPIVRPIVRPTVRPTARAATPP